MARGFIPKEKRQLTEIAERITGRRVLRHLTQADMAREIGKSRTTYTEKENNIGKMYLEDFITVLNALELELTITDRSRA